MTRSEAAAIFGRRLADKNGDTVTSAARTKFADVPANSWYSGCVKYLTGYGIVHGCGNDRFDPDRAITRAEVVAIVNRLLGRTADEEDITANLRRLNTFTDMDKRLWAYYDVMEAANAQSLLTLSPLRTQARSSPTPINL